MHLASVLRGNVRHILRQLFGLRVDLSLEETKGTVSEPDPADQIDAQRRRNVFNR